MKTVALTAAELIADLERRGVTLRRNDAHLRIIPAADLADEEIEMLRRRKAEILEALDTWDRADARRRLEAAWRWADATTPSGCWGSLSDDVRRDLQHELESAYDMIHRAFAKEDAGSLVAGFERFRITVAAVAEGKSVR